MPAQVVHLQVQIKMPARMFLTVKIMPESPEVDFKQVRSKASEVAKKFNAQLLDKDEIEPVAFGLKSLKITFFMDESLGSEDITNELSTLEGVSSAEVCDMRRAVG